MKMRRHRVHEPELPGVKVGLHGYLTRQCADPQQDTEQDTIHAFRLFYRIMNYRWPNSAGQPDYPQILDEDGQIQYTVIKNHLRVAEHSDPDIRRMVPFSTVGAGGGPGQPSYFPKLAPATPTQEAE